MPGAGAGARQLESQRPLEPCRRARGGHPQRGHHGDDHGAIESKCGCQRVKRERNVALAKGHGKEGGYHRHEYASPHGDRRIRDGPLHQSNCNVSHHYSRLLGELQWTRGVGVRAGIGRTWVCVGGDVVCAGLAAAPGVNPFPYADYWATAHTLRLERAQNYIRVEKF